MKTIQKGVQKWLADHQDDGVRLLQRLVQENSVRGNESPAQAVIIEKCRELGLELDIWEINGDSMRSHPFFHSDREDFSGHPNAAAIWKGAGGGRSIILNSHVDVVPEGDLADWEADPFSGAVKDGKMTGRGTTDMKGGAVAFLLAIEALQKNGIRLKGDVVFQSVIEEESGGAGTLSAVLRGYRADGAIITEPTNLKFFPKQQGSMWFRVKIKGKAAHGGTRYEGVSAIEKAFLVVRALEELEKERNARITDPLYKQTPIPIPINIGKIAGGTWPSSVADAVVIEGRMGVAPGESTAQAEKELEIAIQACAEKDPWLRKNQPEVEWFGGRWQPADTDTKHPLIETASFAFERVFGVLPVVEASPWGTDGGILAEWGDTPVLVFGPGDTAAAHQANEFIVLESMLKAAEVLALTIVLWCGVETKG